MVMGEPQVLTYRICWRPGGSLALGFKAHMIVNASDCTQFEDKMNSKGEMRSVPLQELAYCIPGLTSELPYEFCIAAANELGEGPQSQPSKPVILPNASTAPSMPPLVHLRGLEQLLELREAEAMQMRDVDVQV